MKRSRGSNSSAEAMGKEAIHEKLEDFHQDSEYEIVRTINEGKRSTIYHAMSMSDRSQFSIKVPVEYSKRISKKYSKELEIGNKLRKNDSVINYFRTIRYQKSIILVMEYFNGISLHEILEKGETLTTEEFLKIAITITQGLGEIHRDGVMHQHLTPRHILMDWNQHRIKFIDFSSSSVLSKITATSNYVKHLAGGYEYISPEQTGRMNKDVDYRTDYYTLGVIFYRMITGRLPFLHSDPNDPNKIFHSHIAKIPVAPHVVSSSIPLAISNIIIKLLSKNAEERYQSSFGIQYDLQQCLDLLKEGKEADFQVGTKDVHSVFQIHQKLYGREEEIKLLLKSFEKVSKSETSELVLVSGYSGIGKTSLVNEIHKPLVRDGGYFISGKVDQFAKGIPYHSIVLAFKQLIRLILMESKDRVVIWKESLLNALSGKGQVIIDVIPEVELILGPQPVVPILMGEQHQIRFKNTFLSFIRVFATAQHPLVVFLDDLQWADLSTLKLVQLLATDETIKHLFVIGAYRDNEVNETHSLSVILKDIKSKRGVLEIHLGSLKLSHVNQLISDTTRSTLERTKAIAQFTMEETHGNPFFITVFLASLAKNGLVTFDMSRGEWQWDVEEIANLNISNDVVEMITLRIQRMSAKTLESLSLAALIGNYFDLPTLSLISGLSLRESATTLWPVIEEELLLVVGEESSIAFQNNILDHDLHTITFKFLHDRVQQAAYQLIETEKRDEIHLRIGRLLLSKYSKMEDHHLEEKIFDILAHFKKSHSLVTQMDERRKIAKLFLQAANRAKDSVAFGPALEYCALGIELMGDNWSEDHESCFQLAKLQMECTFLNGNYEDAEKMFLPILERCVTIREKGMIYIANSNMYEYQQNYPKCIESASQFLKLRGINLASLELSEEENKRLSMEEFERTLSYLNGNPPSELLKAKEMKDEVDIQTLEIFISAWSSVYYMGKKWLSALVSTQCMNFTIQYGNCKSSALAFCNWLACGSICTDDVKWAFEIGVTGYSLLDIYPCEPLKSRCYSSFAFSSHNVASLAYGIKFLDVSFENAVEYGDHPYVGYTGFNVLLHRWSRGTDLNEIWNVYEKVVPIMKILNRKIYDMNLGLQLPIYHHFSKEFNEEEHVKNFADDFFVMAGYHIGKMQVLFWRERRDYDEIFKAVDNVFLHQILFNGFYLMKEINFEIMLFILKAKEDGALESLSEEKKNVYLSFLEENLALYEVYSSNCPGNHLHKLLIIKAEVERIENRPLEAIRLYKQAKIEANVNQFTQYAALADEMMTELWTSMGFKEYAMIHAEAAYLGYKSWGSVLKMTAIIEKYPEYLLHIREENGNESDEEMEGLDLEDGKTMLRFSEMINKDVSLEQLVDNMMKIIIENSGSQKGIFILTENNGELLMVAEGDLENMQVTTALRAVSFSSMEYQSYPHSIVNYVLRTKEVVVIGNVNSMCKGFDEDSYIKHNGVKSAICFPITQGSLLKGIVYLENRITSYVYNQVPKKIVSSIASQMILRLDESNFSRLLDSEKRLKSTINELQVTRKGLEEFIDVMCHELRNPLNGIHGSKQLLADIFEKMEGEVSGLNEGRPTVLLKEANEMLEAISVSSDHLRDIVDVVLNVSMLEKQSIQLQSMVFNPDDIVKKIELMYKAKFLEKNLSFTKELPSKSVMVVGDPHRLSQILVNIVSNSVKFVEKGGINVKYSYEELRDKLSLNFVVSDTGIGLTKDESEKLFRPFAQANSSIFSKYGGSGLGLKITKEIIELMGGSVQLESTIGVGTSIIFNVVCSKYANQPKRKIGQVEDVQDEVLIQNRKVSRRGHILIVEDNAINQKLLVKILTGQGYTTDQAFNGMEAVEKVVNSFSSKHHFDAVLMDFEMPLMNGIEATQRIRSMEKDLQVLKPLKIIGVSANSRGTHIQTAMEIGMNSYVTKPFQKSDIYNAIEEST
eukprot:TRINITY_DN6184_c0_g2_i1.p1 TRINITY_DN6184_c0_g2~~TRINITY_DN6184_c0_g2_i1.p1  ORF type:complete len:1935 (+),score=471.34 TRINITY_DN6184_c0_g2_i1:55-5859(+)